VQFAGGWGIMAGICCSLCSKRQQGPLFVNKKVAPKPPTNGKVNKNKMFFFEKKNQKTSAPLARGG
jgi:hypothetical protein